MAAITVDPAQRRGRLQKIAAEAGVTTNLVGIAALLGEVDGIELSARERERFKAQLELASEFLSKDVTLEELGSRNGVSRQAIHDKLRKVLPDAELRARRKVMESRRKVRRAEAAGAELVRNGYDLARVAASLNMSPGTARKYLAYNGKVHLVLNEGSPHTNRTYEDAEINDAMRAAAEARARELALSSDRRASGRRHENQLSMASYEAFVRVQNERNGPRVPALGTIFNRYGTWRAACEAAGLAYSLRGSGSRPPGFGDSRFSHEQLLNC